MLLDPASYCVDIDTDCEEERKSCYNVSKRLVSVPITTIYQFLIIDGLNEEMLERYGI